MKGVTQKHLHTLLTLFLAQGTLFKQNFRVEEAHQLKTTHTTRDGQSGPGKQEFRRTDFGSRLLAIEGEAGGWQ
jgi:hypothetical protein